MRPELSPEPGTPRAPVPPGQVCPRATVPSTRGAAQHHKRGTGGFPKGEITAIFCPTPQGEAWGALIRWMQVLQRPGPVCDAAAC